jgi:hypothetical protein
MYNKHNYKNLALNSSRFSTGPNSFEGSIDIKLSKLLTFSEMNKTQKYKYVKIKF